jgi:hypothetical protein
MADLTQVGGAGHGRAVTRGTANVFADLGFPDAIERQVRLRLAYVLNQLLAGRQLSRFEADKVLGITGVRERSHLLSRQVDLDTHIRMSKT